MEAVAHLPPALTLLCSPALEQVVTLFYRPPELLLGCKSYSPTVDVWSAGCVLAEMANTGSPLFVSDSELGQLDDIFAKLGTPSAKAWPELEQMLGATGMGSRAYQPQPLNQVSGGAGLRMPCLKLRSS